MISVVVPVFNEKQSLVELNQRIHSALKGRKLEIIYINDGSTDGSREAIEKLVEENSDVKLVNLRQNQGKSKALMAGFAESQGEIVVTLDADLQDQPEEIEKLIKKLNQGYDLVSGWKRERNDPWHNVILSRLFNLVIGLTTKVYLHDINCGLKVYRREAAKVLELYGDLYRFIPILIAKEGFKVAEEVVNHASRKYGRSKYGISKFARGFFDLFTVLFLVNFRVRPLHLFGAIGGGMIGLGGLICSYLTILWFSGQAIGHRPLLFLGVLLIIVGIQLFTSGLLAELIIYHQGKES